MLLYFPTNKKQTTKTRKKLSWFRGLYMWDYITQSGSASSLNLRKVFPAADQRQVVQLEPDPYKTLASCQYGKCLRAGIIIQLIVSAFYFAFYRVKGTNICFTFRKRFRFAENISKQKERVLFPLW